MKVVLCPLSGPFLSPLRHIHFFFFRFSSLMQNSTQFRFQRLSLYSKPLLFHQRFRSIQYSIPSYLTLTYPVVTQSSESSSNYLNLTNSATITEDTHSRWHNRRVKRCLLITLGISYVCLLILLSLLPTFLCFVLFPSSPTKPQSLPQNITTPSSHSITKPI